MKKAHGLSKTLPIRNSLKIYIFLTALLLVVIWFFPIIVEGYTTMLILKINSLEDIAVAAISPVLITLLISALFPVRIINLNKIRYIFLILPILTLIGVAIPAIIADIFEFGYGDGGQFAPWIVLYYSNASVLLIGGLTAMFIGLIHVLLLKKYF